MRRVHTYYDPVPGVSIEDATRLLLLWRENWSDMGYQPIVLSEFNARQHPDFDAFSARIAKLPTVNNPAYERSCYLRWLAMAKIGGIMCDYDLFCYGKLDIQKGPPPLAITYQKHVPSFVYGGANAYQRIVDFIMGYQVSIKDVYDNGVPHTSDMHILLRGENCPYEGRHIVKNFGDAGWEESPLVHFANAAMGKHQPRWQYIKQLRNWK